MTRRKPYIVRCPTCGWEGQRGSWVRDRHSPTGWGQVSPSEVAGLFGRPCPDCKDPVDLAEDDA